MLVRFFPEYQQVAFMDGYGLSQHLLGLMLASFCAHDLAWTYNNDAIDYCFYCYKFDWRIPHN